MNGHLVESDSRTTPAIEAVAGLPPSRVAFVRGPTLNRAELRIVEPLQDRFAITLVGSRLDHLTCGTAFVATPCLATFCDRLPKVRRVYRDSLQYLLGDPTYLWGLDAVVRRHDVVDVAETYNMYSYQAARLCLQHGKPLLVTVYENTPFFREENPRTARLKAFVRAHASHFIARTQQIKASLIAEGIAKEKIEVIYSAVDVDTFRPGTPDPQLMADLGLSPDDVVMVFVGRLVWEKGVGDLLRALRCLPSTPGTKTNRVKLLIVGDGPEKARLAHLTRALGIDDQVVFAGSHRFDRMPDIYRLADWLVLGSKPYPRGQEQEPRVVREAMACGKPVLATACGGIAEVVGEAGLIVPPADHPAMAAAMLELLECPARRAEFAQRARDRALRDFDARELSEQLGRAYRRLVQR